MAEWQDEITTEFGANVFHAGFSGDTISTGSIVLDFLTGINGLPCGAIVELFGNEGSWKTTLLLTILHLAMKQGRPILYLDYESTISYAWLKRLGIDTKAFKPYHILPSTMEDGFMIMNRFCERYKNGVIGVDSVAAMPPITDVEKMKEVIGQVRVASQAQVMSRAMRQMCSVFKRANHCVIFTNQERSNIDTMGRSLGKKTTPGGAAVKFYSAMRIQMEAVPPGITVETENPVTGKVTKEIVALNIRVKTIKNRFAPSLRQSNIVFRMDKGLDNLYTAIKIAEHVGFISHKGKGRYQLDERYSGEALGGMKMHGIDNLWQYFEDNPKERDLLIADVTDFLAKRLEERNKKSD